jgi:hypothetical protein
MTRQHPGFRFLLVTVGVAAIVAHICVLPGHVHATPGSNGHGHEQPASDHPSSDGVHAASCEALRSAPVSGALPLIVHAPSAAVLSGLTSTGLGRPAEKTTPTSSPPLYLTHRALLI